MKKSKTNYLIGKRTRIRRILIHAQHVDNDHRIELALHKDGDLDGFEDANWGTTANIDLDALNDQVDYFVKKGFEWIELRYPCAGFEFDQITLWEKK